MFSVCTARKFEPTGFGARDNTMLERRDRIATLARLSAPACGPSLRPRPGAEPALLRRSAWVQARAGCPPRVRQALGHGCAAGRRRRAVSDRAEPAIPRLQEDRPRDTRRDGGPPCEVPRVALARRSLQQHAA